MDAHLTACLSRARNQRLLQKAGRREQDSSSRTLQTVPSSLPVPPQSSTSDEIFFAAFTFFAFFALGPRICDEAKPQSQGTSEMEWIRGRSRKYLCSPSRTTAEAQSRAHRHGKHTSARGMVRSHGRRGMLTSLLRLLVFHQHELRYLREEKALLEYQFDSLKVKWQRRLGADSAVLSRACDAARTKRDTMRADLDNKHFKAQLLQQQLYFAALQGMVYQSPVLQILRSRDVFDALHNANSGVSGSFETCCDVGLRLVPAIMDRFAHMRAEKASASAPFSHISIMADDEYTYVCNLFICKLGNQSIHDVFGAAVAYCESLPAELKRCLHVDLDIEEIHPGADECVPSQRDFSHRRHSRSRYSNPTSGVTSSMETLFAAELAENRAVLISDFVEPEQSEHHEDGLDICSALVITAAPNDHATDHGHQVLLQRLVVHRYRLPPSSRKLHDEVKSTLPYFNGDLLMAVICRELMK